MIELKRNGKELKQIAKTLLTGKSIIGVYCKRHSYREVHLALDKSNFCQSVGVQLILELDTSELIVIDCKKDSAIYRIWIGGNKKPIKNNNSLVRIDDYSVWEKRSKITSVKIFSKIFEVFDPIQMEKKLDVFPVALEVGFENDRKIWIASLKINSTGKAMTNVENLLVLDKKIGFRKNRLFEEIEYANPSETKVYEQFTWQGFLTVSVHALMWLIVIGWLLVLLIEMQLLEISSFWMTILVFYGIIWLISFLIECLIPKLRGDK